jgi:hypothetical protein
MLVMMARLRISRPHLGSALLAVGVPVLVAIPGLYATVGSGSSRRGAVLWPTWWMLAPVLLVVGGLVLVAVQRVNLRPAGRRFGGPSDADLEITVDSDRVHRVSTFGSVAAVLVTVRNLTDKPKQLAGTQWNIDGPLNSDWHGTELSRERFALERTHPVLASFVDPHRSITGWLLAELPRRADGGVAGYVITLVDELGVRYTHRQDARGGTP